LLAASSISSYATEDEHRRCQRSMQRCPCHLICCFVKVSTRIEQGRVVCLRRVEYVWGPQHRNNASERETGTPDATRREVGGFDHRAD
jgi:hypothetical protein